ncbi:hypothetical protein DFH28DRAFT_1162103, partial [Melampsora americana]
IVIKSSEEDERPAQSSKNVQNTKLAKPKAPKQTDVLSLCPASTPDTPCDCCKVEKIGGDKVFCCHCGVKPKTLKQGQTEKAVKHWNTESCVESTKRMMNNKALSTFFKRKVDDPLVSSSKFCVIKVACAGLCDATWKQKRATQTIAQFMERSCSIY